MTVRLYVMPTETVVVNATKDFTGPKYLQWAKDPDPPALVTALWALMSFGREPTALVAADVSPAQHTLLAAQPDVTVIPVTLDNELGANLAIVQAELEALNLPSDMLNVNHTYRQVLRGVIAMFKVSQRLHRMTGKDGRLFPSGITLNTTIGQLPQGARDKLQAAAGELGYSYEGLTAGSSLRDVLKKLASQQAPGELLGVVI